MFSLPILAQMTSAAVAASIVASTTYGQYTISSGPDGSGLMPPASLIRPDAGPGAMTDPVAEIARAFGAMKLERAKAARNRAMVDWLVSLQAGPPASFTVQRFDTGLVYAIRYTPEAGEAVGAEQVMQDYIAVPYGPEMSFAVSLRKAGDGSVRMEGYSCAGRETLDVVSLAEAPGAETEALSHAEAYLAAPDEADPGLPADCLVAALKRR